MEESEKTIQHVHCCWFEVVVTTFITHFQKKKMLLVPKCSHIDEPGVFDLFKGVADWFIESNKSVIIVLYHCKTHKGQLQELLYQSDDSGCYVGPLILIPVCDTDQSPE